MRPIDIIGCWFCVLFPEIRCITAAVAAKNYYTILGVSPTSGEAEIKAAYRRMALLLHPDKNPLPEAESAFKEVNEAYEVLSDPISRNLYDQMLTQTVPQPQVWHRDPAYRRRQQAGYKPQRPQGPSARAVMMHGSLRLFRKVAWVALVFCVLLIVDYLLPNRVSEEIVKTDANDLKHIFSAMPNDLLVTDKGNHFPLRIDELKYFPKNSVARVCTSRIFSLLVKVENANGSYEVNNLATLYRNFIFAPLLLLGLSVVGVLWKKGTEFRFNIGVVTVLMMVLNFVFFAISIL